MDGPYRLATEKTDKEKIIGHWYYYYPTARERARGENPKHIKLAIYGVSGRWVKPENAFINHEKAKFWNYEKNYPVTSNMVSLGSGTKRWFNCPTCPHDFETALNNVSRGNWCPYCAIPCKKLCGDKKCEFCVKKSFAGHPKAECWSKKNEIKPHQVFLNCNKKHWFGCLNCPHDFEAALNKVSSGRWCPYCSIPCKKLCGDKKCEFCVKKSFASHPKAECWSDKNKLKPHQVTLHSNKKHWLDCPDCPHDFEARLNDVSAGQWCPYCCIPCQKLCGDIKCEFCFKKSFAIHKRAKYWSKKNTLKPHQVSLNCNKKHWLDCPDCPHDFEMALSGVSSGSWCHYCSNHKICGCIECKFCFKKSFASHEKAKYWSKKNDKKPHEVALNSGTKQWFDCDKCHHDFDSMLSNVSRTDTPRWCPYCSNHKICGCIECKFCFKKSFASHEKAKYWSKKNDKKPHEVALNSGTKQWFDCDKCHHDFEMALSGVSSGRWCPYCKNKTERKLLEWLEKQSWIKKVKHHWRPKWCSTKFIYFKNGEKKDGQYQYEYDFLVTLQNGKQLIIELDGRQHFEQVMNWKSPFHNQIRDAYKERKARQHKLKVIRILQEDVWLDKTDWKETLTHKLKSFQ